MASLGGVFDASTVAPAGTRTLIPAGRYKAHVLRTDLLDNKAQTGKFLWYEIEIIEGEFQGCTLEARMNIVNPNQQAMDIAQRELSALCHATGEMNVSDTDQFIGKPFCLVVKVKPAVMEPDGVTQKYGPQSEVGGYEHISKLPGARPAGAAAPAGINTAGARPMAPATPAAGVLARPATPAASPPAGKTGLASAPWNTPRA